MYSFHLLLVSWITNHIVLYNTYICMYLHTSMWIQKRQEICRSNLLFCIPSHLLQEYKIYCCTHARASIICMHVHMNVCMYVCIRMYDASILGNRCGVRTIAIGPCKDKFSCESQFRLLIIQSFLCNAKFLSKGNLTTRNRATNEKKMTFYD